MATNTPGSDDVEIKEHEVHAIAHDDIVDTNGAGDAFVGGFFAQIFQGKDVDTAVKAGIWLSCEVVQRSGCTFPDKVEFSA